MRWILPDRIWPKMHKMTSREEFKFWLLKAYIFTNILNDTKLLKECLYRALESLEESDKIG